MLKEERKLRDHMKDLDTDHSCCQVCGTESERHLKGCPWWMISPLITALVKAVREDCAKVAEEEAKSTIHCICAERIAATIRRK